jgi:hypothetical protein
MKRSFRAAVERSFTALLSCALVVGGISSSADAALVTYQFTGNVNFTNSALLDGTFVSGQSLTGSLTVNDAPNSDDGITANYSVTSFSVSFPSYTASTNAGSAVVINSTNYGNPNDVEDLFFINAQPLTGAAVTGLNPWYFVFSYSERHAPPVSALTSTALPLDPFVNFGHQPSAELIFDGFNRVYLQNFQVRAVPEPSTSSLMILGFAGMSLMTVAARKVYRRFE